MIYVSPNKVRQANSKYNQDNSFKLSVLSTVVECDVGVIASACYCACSQIKIGETTAAVANSNNSDFRILVHSCVTYIKEWYLFAISVGVCLALALLFIYVRKPVYAVRANLLCSAGEFKPMEAKMGDISALFQCGRKS